MRINQFVAQSSSLSRRAADEAIASGRVTVNGRPAKVGQEISADDTVVLDNQVLTMPAKNITIMLNKPVGYVVSRNGQGSHTIYDLLPTQFRNLKPVGRLDKNSSGLLLLTNDGQLAQDLTHPKFAKEKVYEIELDKPLDRVDKIKIEQGVELEDGLSRLQVTGYRVQQTTITSNLSPQTYRVAMSEGRNRQIRRTFAALGYNVTKLHRTQFGDYKLKHIKLGQFADVSETS